MTNEQEARAQALVAKQLAMNPHTLETLRRAGLQPDDVVTLDFMFVAPDERSAEELRAYLEQNDCESVVIEEGQGARQGEFLVTGRSLPTTLTESVLSEWVPWMVVQGVLRNCSFDGWGTAVPRAEP